MSNKESKTSWALSLPHSLTLGFAGRIGHGSRHIHKSSWHLGGGVCKTLFSYQRDGGGTRGVAQVPGDHWQFAMGWEADGPGINCLSSVHGSTNLSMEFHLWRAKQVVGADRRSREAGGQMVSEEVKGQRACALSTLPTTGPYCKALQSPRTKTCNQKAALNRTFFGRLCNQRGEERVDGEEPAEGCEGPDEHQVCGAP